MNDAKQNPVPLWRSKLKRTDLEAQNHNKCKQQGGFCKFGARKWKDNKKNVIRKKTLETDKI